MAKTPRVNKHECCGCCLCVWACPEVFRLTPDGIAEVFASKGAPEEKIQEVIDDCPILCIHWVEN